VSNLEAASLIDIVVNGQKRSVRVGITIHELLAELGVAPERVAVELNREIVRRPRWATEPIHDGAEIEIVQFVGGGR
jgi:thiamine biosynthesis protein ThiS